MYLMNSLGLLRRARVSGLAGQRVDEESAAHADLPVNTPDGEMYPALLQRFAPRQHVLVNVVDERSVEVEDEGLSSCGWILIISRLAVCHLPILALKEKR